ncbi:hypothetical protein [Teredinibacter turnerae]|uniref:hypothetical protein n=1 Tax=Teredinibacter turnerae TaxID=2426 RepID=UPI000374ED19|nr:hypothetical protein [Teredinibacter turnerae]
MLESSVQSFQVFHSPQESSVVGTRFHLYPATQTQPLDLQEDCGSLDLQRQSARFFYNNTDFEFCGAGALVMANQLRLESETDQFHPFTSSLGYIFWLGVHQYRAAVRLRPADASPTNETLHGLPLSHWFASEKVYAAPLPLAVLNQFQVPAPLRHHLVAHQTTALLYHLDARRQRLYFRYFTGFGEKIEDMATGSVFRYLHAILPAENLEYTVLQLSRNGARMNCHKKADTIIYWGAVAAIPQHSTPGENTYDQPA